ncbi:hypothetical protein DYB34_012864, partial [Aphanomyces astaci]
IGHLVEPIDGLNARDRGGSRGTCNSRHRGRQEGMPMGASHTSHLIQLLAVLDRLVGSLVQTFLAGLSLLVLCMQLLDEDLLLAALLIMLIHQPIVHFHLFLRMQLLLMMQVHHLLLGMSRLGADSILHVV